MSEDPKGLGAGEINLYRYVSNAPVSNRDPSGKARFGKCKLSSMDSMIVNPILDAVQLEVVHEQLFFEDDKRGSVGYYNSGVHFDNDTREKRENYQLDEEYFYDNLMRQAVENVNSSGRFTGQSYDKFKQNCQHYAKAVRDEYQKLTESIGATCGY